MQGHLCKIRLTDQQPGTPERRLRDVVGACEKCPRCVGSGVLESNTQGVPGLKLTGGETKVDVT